MLRVWRAGRARRLLHAALCRAAVRQISLLRAARLALDLVWGYSGILSLGHGAFFALGGYAMGMYLMRQIGTRGVYANPILPDFMVFLNWKELPVPGRASAFRLCHADGGAGPGVLAFVFGWFAFRSRVTGVYLSIITQAMTYALMLAFFRNDIGFGGNNGLTDFKDMLGFNVQSRRDARRRCSRSPRVALIARLSRLPRAIVALEIGKVLIAMRDAESRMRFLGYRVENYKLFVFVVSAMHGRHRGRALRAAGRHHQPERIRAGQLDRGGDLGRGRRPGHAGRRGARRGGRQLRQDLFHRRAARMLAVRARRAVRRW